MSFAHAVVWIDHSVAHIIDFSLEAANPRRSVKNAHAGHLHHHAGSSGSGHARENQAFYGDVVKALGDAREWLLCGPASAKNELKKHVESHLPQLAERIVGVETLDHPSDGELVAHARKFFIKADNLRGTSASLHG